MTKCLLREFAVVLLLGVAGAAAAQPAPPPNKAPDATLRSTPETVLWGYFAADVAPALRIKSGQTVKIDTVSHSGVNGGIDPVTYFGRAGIPADQVLKDAIDIYQKVPRPKGGSAHILTGPLYVDEAVPGDMLEVRIIALRESRSLRRQQFEPRHRCAARSAPRPGGEGHQARPRPQRRAVRQRHRGAAIAVPRDHGGRAATRYLARQLAPARAPRRQHGFQQAHRRGHALPSGLP